MSRSRVEIVAEVVARHGDGEVISYAEFGEALGVGDDRVRVLGAVNAAKKSVERDLGKVLSNERGVGYKVTGAPSGAVVTSDQMIAAFARFEELLEKRFARIERRLGGSDR